MTFSNLKNLTAFAEAALNLDAEFQQLEQLGGQIDRLTIDSDSGLDRAKLLLGRFGECGSRIGEGVQNLAKELEAARARAEKAAELVSARAAAVQARQEAATGLLSRFQTLGEMAGKISSAVTQLRDSTDGAMTEEQRSLLISRLPEVNSQLDVLIEEALRIKEDAIAANLTTLERNADSLGQSLRHARGRLNSVVQSSGSGGSGDQQQQLH
jgi:hypothetical protein